jgi:hypothetical protein
MNLRQAAEMALKYFEDAHGLEDTEVAIKEALRQALAQEWVCCVCGDPKALGIVHSADAPCFYYTKREWVGLTKEDFYKKDDETVFVLGMKFAEATLKEKNT